jgi:hypothetical protein
MTGSFGKKILGLRAPRLLMQMPMETVIVVYSSGAIAWPLLEVLVEERVKDQAVA